MTRTNEPGLAGAVASMVASHDVTDTLAQLVSACAAAYPADAVAILVRNGAGDLDLLSSTSHRVEALELLQIQSRRGPCVESLAADEPVFAIGAAELEARWGDIGSAIVAAGFTEAHAYPMHWQGKAIGGLNIFVSKGQNTDRRVGQLFADLATIAVVQVSSLSDEQLVARVHEAVSSRAVVEQAKGVLAYREDVSMDDAYAALLALATESGTGLTQTASDLVAREHE